MTGFSEFFSDVVSDCSTFMVSLGERMSETTDTSVSNKQHVRGNVKLRKWFHNGTIANQLLAQTATITVEVYSCKITNKLIFLRLFKYPSQASCYFYQLSQQKSMNFAILRRSLFLQ